MIRLEEAQEDNQEEASVMAMINRRPQWVIARRLRWVIARRPRAEDDTSSLFKIHQSPTLYLIF